MRSFYYLATMCCSVLPACLETRRWRAVGENVLNLKFKWKTCSDEIFKYPNLELQTLFSKMLNDKGYIRDANVNIRVINSKVTVIGEVNRPGTYSFSEQNISLNQAIGYAGDLTITGKRKDVLLIRENNGIRTYTKLDLTSLFGYFNWIVQSFFIIPRITIVPLFDIAQY